MRRPIQPRIDCKEVAQYAALYDSGADKPVEELVSKVRSQGFLTKADLIILGDWKSSRIRSRIARNTDLSVEEATGLALSCNSPRLAIHIPQALFGVGMPVASTLVHWFHSERYPILDFRALWSLNIEMPSSYTLDFWEHYVGVARHVADLWEVDMRTLDRALWQYSAAHQPKGSEIP